MVVSLTCRGRGDLGVGVAARHVDEHLALALGEGVEPARAGRLGSGQRLGHAGQDAREHQGSDDRAAGRHRPYGRGQLFGRRVLEQEARRPGGDRGQRVLVAAAGR